MTYFFEGFRVEDSCAPNHLSDPATLSPGISESQQPQSPAAASGSALRASPLRRAPVAVALAPRPGEVTVGVMWALLLPVLARVPIFARLGVADKELGSVFQALLSSVGL